MTERKNYRHADYDLRRKLCRFLLKTIAFTVLAKISKIEGQEHIPQEGGAILMMNHIAFIDPIVLVTAMPRYIVPLAKVESYDYPLVGIFPRLWGVIPINRDGMDRAAVSLALDVLKAGEILLVAPEGTRNPALMDPKEGVAYLASRSQAPILPVALEYTNGFPTHPFSKRWQEEGAHIKYGPKFKVKEPFQRARGETLTKVARETVYALARMLPEQRRGQFADLSKATEDTIEWV